MGTKKSRTRGGDDIVFFLTVESLVFSSPLRCLAFHPGCLLLLLPPTLLLLLLRILPSRLTTRCTTDRGRGAACCCMPACLPACLFSTTARKTIQAAAVVARYFCGVIIRRKGEHDLHALTGCMNACCMHEGMHTEPIPITAYSTFLAIHGRSDQAIDPPLRNRDG
jgi:hypothetical protein